MKERSDYQIISTRAGFTVKCGNRIFFPGVYTNELEAEKAIERDMSQATAALEAKKRGRPSSSEE